MIISNAVSFYLKWYFTRYFVNKLLDNAKGQRVKIYIYYLLEVFFEKTENLQNENFAYTEIDITSSEALVVRKIFFSRCHEVVHFLNQRRRDF